MKQIHTNIAKLIVLSVVTVLFGFWGCGGKEDVPEQPSTINDVEFAVPESMDVDYGSDAISFRVQFSKPPKTGDYISLGSFPSCAIRDITSSSFNVDISGLWDKGLSSNTYTVTLKRGTASRKMGEMKLNVKTGGDEITPTPGYTVYGVVSSQGTGIADVVVSDGVETAKTDYRGVYQLKSNKETGYVFVSVPSDYEPYCQGILPVFHEILKKPASVAERVDFQLQPVSGQESHTMLIMGDIHLANRTGDKNQFTSFVNDINSFRSTVSGPVYGLTLGDMTWDLYWKANAYGFTEYVADANKIKNLTIYHTIGNHDHSMFEMGDVNTVKEYREKIAPTYYSFNIGSVHYVVLDDVLCTNGKNGTAKDDKGNQGYNRSYDAKIDDVQMEWLKKDLSYVSTSTPIVVAMHIPLYKANGANNMGGASDLATLLSKYPKVHVYTAHTHTIYNVDKTSAGHIFEHNAGSVCGTWWWSAYETPGVHIGQDGSPGGYTVLKVNGVDFSWQYKATGSDPSYQFRTYDRNSIAITADAYIPKATNESYKALFKPGIWEVQDSSNEVYINVWNYDPSWEITVTENGTPLTVSKVTVPDPLHLISYTAKRVNKNAKPSFATENNSHTFKVKASSANSTLEILVKDGFKNEYTETMTRPKAFNTEIYKH